MQELKPGVFVPIITPFRRNGEIDFESLKRQADYLLANGIDGLVVGGTTGEGHALTVEEKKKLIDFAVNYRQGHKKKFTIITGTGTQKIGEATKIAKYAMEKGCDALLALPPRTRDQTQIVKFYMQLSSAAPIPTLAYNIPSVAGTCIKPETIATLVGKRSVIGVKDSAQDPNLLVEWKKKAPTAFVVVGEDKLIEFGIRRAKASAVIPGTGNVAPKQVVSVFKQARIGKGKKAQQHLNKIVDELLATKNFGGAVKAILQRRGTIKSQRRRIGKGLSSPVRRKLLSRAYRPR